MEQMLSFVNGLQTQTQAQILLDASVGGTIKTLIEQ